MTVQRIYPIDVGLMIEGMCHVRRAHRQFRSDCIIALLDSRSGDIDQAMKIEPVDFSYLSTLQVLGIGDGS